MTREYVSDFYWLCSLHNLPQFNVYLILVEGIAKLQRMINELKCLVLFCFATCEPCQDILMYCVVQKLSQFTCSWLIWSLSREMPSCSFCLPCFIPAAKETVVSHSVSSSLRCILAAVPLQPFLCLFFHQGITVWSSFFSRSPLSQYMSHKRQRTLGTRIHHACLHTPDLCLPILWPPQAPPACTGGGSSTGIAEYYPEVLVKLPCGWRRINSTLPEYLCSDP